MQYLTRDHISGVAFVFYKLSLKRDLCCFDTQPAEERKSPFFCLMPIVVTWVPRAQKIGFYMHLSLTQDFSTYYANDFRQTNFWNFQRKVLRNEVIK